jgi:biopolymer transport protein TolR
MGINSNNNNNRHLLSEINVTPFVDVMLVLLVIFMVTAPILYQGVDVNLPKTSSQPIPNVSSTKNIIVTVDKDGKIYIEKKQYGLNELRAKIRSFIKQSGKSPAEQEVFLRADQDVPYGSVMEVMANIRSAGVEKVGLITDPLLEEKLQ